MNYRRGRERALSCQRRAHLKVNRRRVRRHVSPYRSRKDKCDHAKRNSAKPYFRKTGLALATSQTFKGSAQELISFGITVVRELN